MVATRLFGFLFVFVRKAAKCQIIASTRNTQISSKKFPNYNEFYRFYISLSIQIQSHFCAPFNLFFLSSFKFLNAFVSQVVSIPRNIFVPFGVPNVPCACPRASYIYQILVHVPWQHPTCHDISQ